MKTANPHIKQISVFHLSEIQALAKQTYTETFATHNTPENMQAYLDEAFSTKQLSAELMTKQSRWFLAMMEDEEAGYLKINFGNAQTEMKDRNAMEIERIYVLQKFQGQHIGKAFLEKAVDIASENGVDYLWLGVWEKNTKAKRFYEKSGFTAFGKHSFFMGNDEQTDIMMKLELDNKKNTIANNHAE